MTELILKSDLDDSKLEILMKLLASWNIKLEVKKNSSTKSIEKISFFDGAGIWQDYEIDAKKLREAAWKRGSH